MTRNQLKPILKNFIIFLEDQNILLKDHTLSKYDPDLVSEQKLAELINEYLHGDPNENL